MATGVKVLSPSGTVNAGNAGVVTPFQFVVTGEDILRWRVYVFAGFNLGDVTAELTIRMIDPTGIIQVTKYTQDLPFPGGRIDTFIPLGVGAIVNLAVRYTSVTNVNQAVYSTVHLVRGTTGVGGTIIGQILGGYIGPGCSLAWPGSPVEPWWRGGSGAYQVIPFGATLGSEAVLNLHAPGTFRPIGITGVLTTSAGGPTRQVEVLIKDFASGTLYLILPSFPPQAGGVANGYLYGVGYGFANPGGLNQFFAPLPEGLILPLEITITTFTTNLQLTDAWTNVNLFGEALIGPAVTDG